MVSQILQFKFRTVVAAAAITSNPVESAHCQNLHLLHLISRHDIKTEKQATQATNYFTICPHKTSFPSERRNIPVLSRNIQRTYVHTPKKSSTGMKSFTRPTPLQNVLIDGKIIRSSFRNSPFEGIACEDDVLALHSSLDSSRKAKFN